MANSYLDKNGLTYLWSKIKDYVQEQGPGGGDSTWKEGDTTASRPIKYRLRNGICFLTAFYSAEVSVGDTPVLVYTLPVGYRPTTTVYFSVTNRGASAQGFGYVDTSGRVYLRNSLGTMGYFSFSVAYPVD